MSEIEQKNNNNNNNSSTNPLRIVFTGSMGHGKSTCAEYVRSKHGGIEIMLAKKLKDMVADILHLTDEQRQYLWDPKLKMTPIPGYGVTARKLLQKIGTELFRQSLNREI